MVGLVLTAAITMFSPHTDWSVECSRFVYLARIVAQNVDDLDTLEEYTRRLDIPEKQAILDLIEFQRSRPDRPISEPEAWAMCSGARQVTT